VDEDLPVMLKLQMWYICGFSHNKNFLCRWDQKTCTPLHSMHWKKGWLHWEMVRFENVTDCCTWSKL